VQTQAGLSSSEAVTQRRRPGYCSPVFSAVLQNSANENAEEIKQDQHDHGQCHTRQKPEASVQPRIDFLKHIAEITVDFVHCASPSNQLIYKPNDLACCLVPFAVSAADALGRLNAA